MTSHSDTRTCLPIAHDNQYIGHAIHSIGSIKGPPIKKALICIKHLPEKSKMAFLSRKLKLLAILLHGQFIHHTHISLYPNTQFFTAQQRAYQSFLVTSCFDTSQVLALLLFEQYIHHTQASLRPNTEYFSAKQYSYPSFLSYFLL